MKKIGLLAIIIATALFTGSCARQTEQGEKATNSSSITIELQGAEMTKANDGQPSGNDDNTVNDYVAFVFDAGGMLLKKQHQTGSAAMVINSVSTTASDVYVVANTGALATGPFASVNNKAALLAATGKLMNAAGTASNLTKTSVWMEGNAGITWTGTGDSQTANVTVAMKFVAARILVNIDATGFTNVANTEDNFLTFTELNLLYAGGEAKFFATDANKCVQKNFYTGLDGYANMAGSSIAGGSTTQTDVLNVSGLGLTGGATSKNTGQIYFYVFGNDATTQNDGTNEIIPTVLSLKAVDKIGTVTYFVVRFDGVDAEDTASNKHTIVPGKSYTVNMFLKGTADNPGGGPDPEDPTFKGKLTVTVTAATWLPEIVINKDFE